MARMRSARSARVLSAGPSATTAASISRTASNGSAAAFSPSQQAEQPSRHAVSQVLSATATFCTAISRLRTSRSQTRNGLAKRLRTGLAVNRRLRGGNQRFQPGKRVERHCRLTERVQQAVAQDRRSIFRVVYFALGVAKQVPDFKRLVATRHPAQQPSRRKLFRQRRTDIGRRAGDQLDVALALRGGRVQQRAGARGLCPFDSQRLRRLVQLCHVPLVAEARVEDDIVSAHGRFERIGGGRVKRATVLRPGRLARAADGGRFLVAE